MADNYGSDILLGATGIDPRFPIITGGAVVAYNIFRRVTTKETLPAYHGNSIDLAERAGNKLDPKGFPSLERDIIRVCVFEERVSTVRPTVKLDTKKDQLNVRILIVLVTGETFTLVMDLSTVNAQVLNVAVL
ncbi:MAG TPA: hypothetical protein PKV97_00180 [Thauera aminoaromatica]|nr:hypothetical protein [Thauera aminoaromatica]